ncbi:hypothetical protein ACQ4PT_052520 [Festuca glaucescens]
MELPPFAPVDAAAAARAIFRGEGGDEKEGGSNSTAIKWVRRCCPQLPASLVQKLFRLRKVKKNAVTAETSSADASTEQFRLKRVSAKDHLVLGDTLFLPVNIQESSVAEKTRKFDNRNEIEFLRSLEIHKGGVGIKNSIDVLAPMFEENSSDAPRLVHRLDRDCSGVLVLGRTQLSASILHAIFREKTADALADGTQQVLQRKYVALVMGTPRHPKGLLSAPLAKVQYYLMEVWLLQVLLQDGKSERLTVRAGPNTTSVQDALTEYRVIESCPQGFTWLELFPLTGRKHQGCVVVGAGGAKMAATDVFMACASRDVFMARLRFAIKLGPMYWVYELSKWVYKLRGYPVHVGGAWYWDGVIRNVLEQNDGTCSICGTLVCLEARHRLDFERRHGFKTFPYSISAQTAQDLKNLCVQRRVWTPRCGANKERVLQVIQQAGGSAVPGVPGWKPCRLQVKSWKVHENTARHPISEDAIANLIRTEGPLLGGIIVDDDYSAPGSEDQVYRGIPRGYRGGGRHCVVCAGYRFWPKPTAQPHQGRRRHRPRHDRSDTRPHDQTETHELHVFVVDNQVAVAESSGGSRNWSLERWILAKVFTNFVEVHVEPLDATELRSYADCICCLVHAILKRYNANNPGAEYPAESATEVKAACVMNSYS